MIVLSACLKNILTDNGILKAEPLVVCGAKPHKRSQSVPKSLINKKIDSPIVLYPITYTSISKLFFTKYGILLFIVYLPFISL